MENIHKNYEKQASCSSRHTAPFLSPKPNNSLLTTSCYPYTEGGGSSLFPCLSIMISTDTLGLSNLCSLESRAVVITEQKPSLKRKKKKKVISVEHKKVTADVS